jgi:deoxycytidylate deaminase
MSLKQTKIISTLLDIASKKSKQSTKVAAAIVRGNKILAVNVNTHRSKFGTHIRCAGHAEVACLHRFCPEAFRNKGKGCCVL